ncbi:Na/Pi symporter [Paremcibacter congregatus]|uniref:Sodium:phosphate symporter n=1 Tax=Paremcibacter congregatus TaxID=2043170 RepID=A0A2G4YRQ7_9PROT|nr:Na/Pi symporter [Paremcibacter congregatus]PHZ84998.1 sodium:phosphate symporter [Paremcibacter congregatus]QDE26027.1 Na/Pi cotransporter family protein [Paremcibacter congregatus]
MNDFSASGVQTEENNSLVKKTLQWLTVIFLIYMLVMAVGMIGSGFKGATKGQVGDLFAFATNPFMGLIVGVIATAMVQSSSTVTSIIVGLVAGGLPVEMAVPMIMGANIGTTITNTIVSLGHIGRNKEFRRAFAAATVHDFFNLMAVAIFLPIEIIFHPLQKAAGFLAEHFVGGENMSVKGLNFIKPITKPVIAEFKNLAHMISEQGTYIILVIFGITIIFCAIVFIGKLLKKLMVGRAKEIMHASIGRGPLTSIFSGSVVTILVQSSSTTTSLMVPLAGNGVFKLKQIYPFTLGANIGTTITALLAATAISGPTAILALQIALVHLIYNSAAVILIYGIKNLRKIPIRGAMWLARVAAKRKIIALIYMVGVFFVTPGLMVFLYQFFA